MPLCKERSKGFDSPFPAGEGSGRIEIVLLKVKRFEAEICVLRRLSNNLV